MSSRTIEIGAKLCVVPAGGGAAPDGCVGIVVGPGAFGSGEHVTTASCLEILEGLAGLRGAEVLDLGSGTGILGIAALLLGARRAVLVDIDPSAVATARRNCERNGVSDRAVHVVGSLPDAPPGPYDLVLANLHADILLAAAAPLVGAAVPGARIILSGILWEDDLQVRSAYERLGCRLIGHRMLDDYSTMLFAKPARA